MTRELLSRAFGRGRNVLFFGVVGDQTLGYQENNTLLRRVFKGREHLLFPRVSWKLLRNIRLH